MNKNHNSFTVFFLIGTVVYGIAAVLFLNCSRTDWMVANGSDSCTAIYRLTILQQISALVLVPVLIHILLTKTYLIKTKACQILFRAGLFITAASLFFLAFNTLTINGKNDTVAQIWVIWHYNKLPYAGSEFPDGRIHIKKEMPPFITFSNDVKESKTYFLGIPPFHLNKEAISRNPLIIDRNNK